MTLLTHKDKNILRGIIVSSIVQFALFFLQYVILPAIYTIYPSDAEQILNAISISSISTYIAAMSFNKKIKLRYWIFSFPVYVIATSIYHPQNIYGIGYGMFGIPWFTIVFLALVVFVCEILSWTLLAIVYKIITIIHRHF